MVEYIPFKDGVVGSSPAAGTISTINTHDMKTLEKDHRMSPDLLKYDIHPINFCEGCDCRLSKTITGMRKIESHLYCDDCYSKKVSADIVLFQLFLY